MKRFRIFLITLVSAFLVFTSTVHAAEYTRYSESLPIYVDSEVNETTLTMISYITANTPLDLLYLLYQENVHINITQTVSKSERGASDGVAYSATYYYEGSTNKVVYVEDPAEMYLYTDSYHMDAYFHECGHILEYIAEYITGYCTEDYPISSSAEWQALYAQYASVMEGFDDASWQNMYNAHEAFAEAFRFYFTYPELLVTNCPEVYVFVANQIAIYTAYVPALSYENFDYVGYATMYPDVAAVYGTDKDALWEHYNTLGIAEGRIAGRIITPKNYGSW